MDTFLDVSGIVKRAKQALNFKKDSELASYLGVSRATLSNWCARNRIDFHLLLNKMRDVDLNWLLVGKGTPRHQTKLCKSDLASGEVQMIHNPKTVEMCIRDSYKAAQHYLPNLIADRQTDNNGSLLQHYHSGLQPHGYYPNDPGQNSDT